MQGSILLATRKYKTIYTLSDITDDKGMPAQKVSHDRRDVEDKPVEMTLNDELVEVQNALDDRRFSPSPIDAEINLLQAILDELTAEEKQAAAKQAPTPQTTGHHASHSRTSGTASQQST